MSSEGAGPAGASEDVSATEVVDVPDAGRWEVRVGDRLAGIAQYVLVPGGTGGPDRVVFFHTEVRPEYEGQGLAARLVVPALDAAVAAGRVIVPVCPYVRAYVARHRDAYGAHVVAVTEDDLEAVERAA